MEGGVLEVLIVNAQGIERKNIFGKPAYFALIKCGTEIRRSKTTKGYHHKAFWNQKFKFEFPVSEWKKLTHLEISIMDDKSLKDPGCVGTAVIFLGGIIEEGNNRGQIELHPSPYNVVLEDTTYKGHIKVGLKFKVKNDRQKEPKEETVQVMEAGNCFYRSLFRVLKISSWSWTWRVFFPCVQY